MPAAELPRWRPPRPRGGAWLVLALHAALLGALVWQTSWQTLEHEVDRQAPLMLRWFAPPPARPVAPPSPRAAQPAHAPPPVRVHARTPPRSEAVTPAEVSIPAGSTATATAASPAPAASRSDAPMPDIPLLATDATRRAVHDIARQVPIDERAALASAEPTHLRTEERLGREVAKAAIGDCLKGEYNSLIFTGVLRLPFFVAAEAAGKCRK